MQLQVVKNRSSAIKAFSDREWAIADTEHFGKPSRWQEENYYLKALDKNNLVGLLHYSIKAGVVEIITIIVSSKHRNQGIGTMLMKRVEALAKVKRVHKLFLLTGKGWKEMDFYKKMGFIKTGELKRHLLEKDWLVFSKFLN